MIILTKDKFRELVYIERNVDKLSKEEIKERISNIIGDIPHDINPVCILCTPFERT
jgi:hypothetical protein